MKAHAVIGANYGDEGKGLITDYLASKGADAVIRFNGGAQAGHTVVTPAGQRHVFHHYGSGSLVGVPTYLSRFFVTNPILFAKEDVRGNFISVHPDSRVTTPLDMLINQAISRASGIGSCGVGINETMQRSRIPKYCMTVDNMSNIDLQNSILFDWYPKRLKELRLSHKFDKELGRGLAWMNAFKAYAEHFLAHVSIDTRPVGHDFIFEGAQGLLLDMDHPSYPHVTHSKTGIHNVLELCDEWGIKNLKATYVTRSYLTRHGTGPLPNEAPMPSWVVDKTNVPHDFQGILRYAPLDVRELERRVSRDAMMHNIPTDIAVTCLDQSNGSVMDDFTLSVGYESYGPTRDDVFQPL